jgi:endonuclease YncB( thermonuclease family)
MTDIEACTSPAMLLRVAPDVRLGMLEAGLAEVYRGPEEGHPYQAPFQAAEDIARTAKQGMWTLGAHYESPRAYRKRVGIS